MRWKDITKFQGFGITCPFGRIPASSTMAPRSKATTRRPEPPKYKKNVTPGLLYYSVVTLGP